MVEQDKSFNSEINSMVDSEMQQLNELKLMREETEKLTNILSNKFASEGSQQVQFAPPQANIYNSDAGDAAMSSQPAAVARPGRQVSFSPYMLYTPEYDPYSESTQQKINATQGYISQVRTAPFLADPMRTNKRSRDSLAMQYGGNVANAAISGLGTTAGIAGDFASMALFSGMVPGLLAGSVGGAAIGGYFDNGLKQAKQQQELNQFLFQNSYRFISRSESNDTRHKMGFSNEERYDVSDFIRNINSEKFLKDDEVMKMMQDFTDYDMMRTVSDVKTFKERMSKLIDVTKSSALLLNENYDSVTAMMGEMTKVGIDAKDFAYLSAGAKITGSETGQKGSEVMGQLPQLIQSVTSGTTLNTRKVGESLLFTETMLGQLQSSAEKTRSTDKEDELIYNYFSTSGGTEGVLGKVVNTTLDAMRSGVNTAILGYAFNYDDKTGTFGLNRDKFNELLGMKSGDVQEYVDKGMKNLSSMSMEAQAKWADDDKRLMEIRRNLGFEGMIQYSGNVVPKAIESNEISDNYKMELMGIVGEDEKRILLRIADTLEKNGGYERAIKDFQYQSLSTANQATIEATTTGNPFKRIEWWWEGQKDKMGNPFASMSDWFEQMGVEVADKWYNRQHMNYDYKKEYSYSADAFNANEDDIKNSANIAVEAMKQMGDVGLDPRPGVLHVTDQFGNKTVKIADDESELKQMYGNITGKDKSVTPTYDNVMDNLRVNKKDLEKRMKTLTTADQMLRKNPFMASYVKKTFNKYDSELLEDYQDAFDKGTNIDEVISRMTSVSEKASGKDKELILNMLDRLNNKKDINGILGKFNTFEGKMDNYKTQTVQLGETGLRLFSILGLQDTKDYKEFFKMVDKDQKNVPNMTIDEMSDKANKEREFLYSSLSKRKDSINNYLMDLGSFGESLLGISGNDKKWDDSEIKVLVSELTKVIESGELSPEEKSKNSNNSTDGDSSKTMTDHEKAMQKVLNTMQKEIDDMNSFVMRIDKGRSYDYGWR